MWKSIKTFVAAMAAQIDARDCVLTVGLSFVAIGLAQVWAPLAFIVPGAVLTYVAVRGPSSGDVD